MKTHSPAFLRRRRFLLVLPLLVLPFLAMAFWSLGGGGTAASAQQAVKGLNLRLPPPQLNEKAAGSKLHLYQQARHKLQQLDTGGKNFLHQLGLAPAEKETPLAGQGGLVAAAPQIATPGFGLPPQDPQEERINERLSRLSQLVRQETLVPAATQAPGPAGRAFETSGNRQFSQDVAKLEKMMRTMGGETANEAANPELRQLENLLAHILDIQHPERVTERLRDSAGENGQQVYAVQAASKGLPVTLLHPSLTPSSAPVASLPVTPAQPAFYSLQEGLPVPARQGNLLEAVVHETQTLRAGATVKLRLRQDAFLGGRLLPQGSLLYGTCQIRGERLFIAVASIRAGNALVPVSLSAYDLDGLEGLHIPGAPVREAARQGAGRAISQSLQLPSLSPSLGVQAAGAGLNAARGLLSKQARQVKITVKAGYRLLLRDQQALPVKPSLNP